MPAARTTLTASSMSALRVVLLQDRQHRVADRLDGGDQEQAAQPAQLRQDGAALQDVLDLGGDVEGQRRETRRAWPGRRSARGPAR